MFNRLSFCQKLSYMILQTKTYLILLISLSFNTTTYPILHDVYLLLRAGEKTHIRLKSKVI